MLFRLLSLIQNHALFESTINAIIPAITSIGIAMYNNPTHASPIKNAGNRNTVQTIFAIPHAAFIPNINIFHATQINAIINIIVTI